MKRFVEGAERGQSTMLPECLDDWVDESNPVRAVDAFVGALNLEKLGYDGVIPEGIRSAGFDLTELRTEYASGPRPMTYMYLGRASRYQKHPEAAA